MVILATVCRRAFLEAPSAAGQIDDDPETERYDLLAWLRDEGLDRHLSGDETRLLATLVGSLTRDDTAAASWAAEGLMTFAWTGGLSEGALTYAAPSDPTGVVAAIPAPWDRTAPFLARIALRPEEEIARERERAELWYWRAQAEEARTRSGGRPRAETEAAIREVAAEAAEAGLLPSAAGDDFAVDAQPFRVLDERRKETVGAIALQRLRALNWLCGFGADWDRVPLDV